MIRLILTLSLLASSAWAQYVRVPFAAPSGSSPISLVAHQLTASTNGTGFTTSTLNTTGATLLVAILADIDSTVPTFSSSPANTWTTLTAPTGSCSNSWCINILYVCAPTVSATQTFTVSSASSPSLGILAFSGVTTCFDTNTGHATQANASTVQSGSITPAHAQELFVTGVSTQETTVTTISINSGFTVADTALYSAGNHVGLATAYLLSTGSSAQNPTWTVNNANNWLESVMGAYAP